MLGPKTWILENFFDWEEDLNVYLAEKPHARKIIWVMDKAGGRGKTTYGKHLCATR